MLKESQLILGLEIKVMNRFDKTDGPSLRAHHNAVGHRSAREKSHPAQIIAGGYAGRREHDVFPRQLFERVAMLQIDDPHREAGLRFLRIARHESTLHLAADRTNRG